MNLLAIIDHSIFGDAYLETASKCAEFVDMIWYRIKAVEPSEVFKRASDLRYLLKDKKLILSERADIACLCSFDGVHLNSSCIPPFAIKKAFPHLTVGYSAHKPEECRDQFCDYFTLSPIFPTPKPYDVTPIGLIQAPAPNVYALGGITPDKINDLKSLGYMGAAGIRLCNSDLSQFNINHK